MSEVAEKPKDWVWEQAGFSLIQLPGGPLAVHHYTRPNDPICALDVRSGLSFYCNSSISRYEVETTKGDAIKWLQKKHTEEIEHKLFPCPGGDWFKAVLDFKCEVMPYDSSFGGIKRFQEKLDRLYELARFSPKEGWKLPS